MDSPNEEEEYRMAEYLKLIKCSNNVEFKTNEEIDALEICMEKSINLKIMQYFVNIEELYLIKNNISDITPLLDCTNLRVLFLQINKITSILGLGKLKKLEKLNLFSNELTESGIDLRENKQIHYIDLSDNALESIDFLWGTNSFVHINLANNRIRTLDPLRNNTNLEHLNVSGNRLERFEDVQALLLLPNVKELYLSSIYYRSNTLVGSLLYKHYFCTNFPNLRILDHQLVSSQDRKLTARDMETLKSISDFKMNFIEEKYIKEKHHLLFINNKNLFYLNEVLWPIHFYFNMEGSPSDPTTQGEHERMAEIKREVSFLLSAYTSRFNYIMRRLKEERDLQIKYVSTAMNSYFNIFFQVVTKQHSEYTQVEDLLKRNFSAESLKSYFVEDIKIESIVKVKKLNHGCLDALIEDHLNSVVYKKNLLFLHPYNYCKINDHFDFDEKEFVVEDPERRKFFERNFVCSCRSLRHVLKTAIRTFLAEDQDDLVHPIYRRSRGAATPAGSPTVGVSPAASFSSTACGHAADLNLKKKIVRSRRFDFPPVRIYVVESYFFPNEHKEVTAYSSSGCREEKEKKEESKFKIYYTKPRHTNLKFIVNVSLVGSGGAVNSGGAVSRGAVLSKGNSLTRIGAEKRGKEIKKNIDMDLLNCLKIQETVDTPNGSHEKRKLKKDFYECLLTFNSINFFYVTKYFIKLSKIICEIKKCVSILLARFNLKHLLPLSVKNFEDKLEVTLPEHVHILEKKRLHLVRLLRESSTGGTSPTAHTTSEGATQDGADRRADTEREALHLNSFHVQKLNFPLIQSLFKNLKELCLVNNNISDLSVFFHCGGQEGMDSLVHLDLSFNSITTLAPICNKFRKLIHFDISFNCISDYVEISIFSRNHKEVQSLSFGGNSLYVKPSHQEYIRRIFPRIVWLNGVRVTSSGEFHLEAHSSVESPWGEGKASRKKAIIPKEPKRSDYLNKVEVVNMSNFYTPLPISDFSVLPNLKELNLANNGMESVDDLKLPTTLRKLNLRNNRLRGINFLKSNLNIEVLILNKNDLANIDMVNCLRKLKVLRCAHNKLETIPLMQNAELVELNIHDNVIKDITHLVLMKKKKSLRCINIYNNKINFPNLELYIMHTFRNLIILNGNYISRGDHVDSFFKNIYTVNVFHDLYNLFPPYTSLRSLEIKNLKIRSIMFRISNEDFPNLERLDLSNNFLSSIANVGPLDGLKVLLLNNNKHIIDESFTGPDGRNVLNCLKSLEELDISSCMLCRTDFLSKCTHLKNLRSLNLEGNNIHSVKSLSHLESLLDLNLSNNKVSKMCPDAFPSQVKRLSLSNNLIRNLAPLRTLQNLETLDLRVNRIDNEEEFTSLRDMHKLRILYLNGNRKIKEHFPNIRNMLKQVETFDDKIVREHDEIMQHMSEKKEWGRSDREGNAKEQRVEVHSAAKKDPTKEITRNINREAPRKGVAPGAQTKVQRPPKKKDSFDEVIATNGKEEMRLVPV
ncbi:hypothetical protein C922_03090 [Plasmodium inui San Antonio 1]|uniref:Leucine-rich repeat protein n=1 Tax=Plasmodium inui San Antonio 1 TaxID=1237626 RepID=W7AMA8_9APIC|nr:hypothetical protein C922_03090 [Plasmodium inui San Antonio 1]EUD66456.1 hypothetical protein C922_03090 [Plasmodium inui San Antonio 1]